MRTNKTSITFVFPLLAALLLAPAVASAQNNYDELEFDVAENGLKFSFQSEPLESNGFPAYGNPFVTTGYLYSAGTLSVDSSGVVNGVNADGSPQFGGNTRKGTWHCSGWFIGPDGANTVEGPWTNTVTLYQINGKGEISTAGLELSDIGVTGTRSVTGGTGWYKRVSGTQEQTLLGFNQTFGVGLRVKLKIFR
jgi:hypothetical protein